MEISAIFGEKQIYMNRLFSFLLFFITFSSLSQTDFQSESPYKLNGVVDGSYLGASLSLNAVGFYLVQNKDPLSEQELQELSRDNIWGVDRWSAGNYSERADNISYYPFFGSFAMPFVMMLADNKQRSHVGQISVLFIETMATTGALYTFSAGLIERPRPLVYNTSLAQGERTEPGAQRSFFAGHTAATAAATFFTAKVFSDFNPDSWASPYVWTAAALVPAWVGYLRLEAGKHFISDNLIGYGIGAMSGILIPELHKKENNNMSLYPIIGVEYQGLTLTYTF